MVPSPWTSASDAISFPLAPALPMLSIMDGSLPPGLEQFATDAVASGRFESHDDALAAGLVLLREEDAEVASFVASLDAAKEEGERLGFRSIEEVMRKADALLDELDRARE